MTGQGTPTIRIDRGPAAGNAVPTAFTLAVQGYVAIKKTLFEKRRQDSWQTYAEWSTVGGWLGPGKLQFDFHHLWS